MEAASRKSDFERSELQKDKTGVFTGAWGCDRKYVVVGHACGGLTGALGVRCPRARGRAWARCARAWLLGPRAHAGSHALPAAAEPFGSASMLHTLHTSMP